MSAISVTTQPAQRLLTDVLGPALQRAEEGTVKSTGAQSAPREATKPDDATPEITRSEVTLSAQASAQALEPRLPVVFAEVWHEGMKVALIDANGGVKSLTGMVASTQGTSGAGGILLAARRAAEVAASIGGEIRVGGQPIDKQTLATRAKLTATYGSSL